MVTNTPNTYTTSSAPFLRDATFTWHRPETRTDTVRRNFRLQIDGTLAFKEGAVNLVCGPTGSGKTSLLMALLGEMHFRPSGPNSLCHLPREDGVAYAAQEAWVFNDSIQVRLIYRIY